MGITSYIFVLIYLPFTLLGWTGLNRIKRYKEADVFLIVVSLVFIGSYNYRFILILMITVCVNYIIAKYMCYIESMRWRKIIVVLAVAINIGILVFLKYCNWIRVLINPNAILWSVIIPIGISFYTLEQVCYLIDTYKSCEMKYTILEYLLFSTYFPVIVSGPILRHNDFIAQLRTKECRKVSPEKVCEGLILFCLGMGKKVIVASYLGKLAALGFDNVESAKCLTMIVSVLAYTLQLYFDFSGYCDIVEGISYMLGFYLPINFNSPYKSVSIGEFWKKWHMTLTSFLTKYVYIPLGGNKKGKIRQYLNIFIVFLVSGFWHGASFTYVLWGIMHGFCMVIDKIIGKIWVRIPKTVGRLATFITVALMWVPFRAKNIEETYIAYKTILLGERTIVDNFGQYTFPLAAYMIEHYVGIEYEYILRAQNIITILILISLVFVVFYAKNVIEICNKSNKKSGMAVLCGVILFIAVLQFQEVGNFIYEGF